MDEDIEEGARRLMRAGFALILAGLATGFAVPVLEAPRMGLASHVQGLLNGMLLVILGLVWPRFGLGTRARRVAYWAALYGAVADWGVTFLSGSPFWGCRQRGFKRRRIRVAPAAGRRRLRGMERTPMTDETGYHWQLMRRAIARIDAEGGRALPLEALAAEMNMSPAHFQRVFTAFAGVSPKRFQQYLTLGHARRLLETRMTTLAAADEAGLSGTGRLHDLFVTWEAMTPGDYAKRGRGLRMAWAWEEGPFGRMLGMATERGLAGLAFAAEVGDAAAMEDLRARWPEADFVEDQDALGPHFAAAFGEGEAACH